jgi:hypothetical protein
VNDALLEERLHRLEGRLEVSERKVHRLVGRVAELQDAHDALQDAHAGLQEWAEAARVALAAMAEHLGLLEPEEEPSGVL